MESKLLAVAEAAGLKLKRAANGRYKTLCPFHEDSDPSLQLTPWLDCYRCWSCGARGGYLALAKCLRINVDDALPRESQVRHASRPTARTAPVQPEPTRLDPFDGTHLSTRCLDLPTLRYVQGRGWANAIGLGLLRFTRAGEPLVWRGRKFYAFENGYRIGVLLLDMDGKPTGLQVRRLTGSEDKDRFRTRGYGSFGSRSRITNARHVYLAEGLGDYLAAVLAFDMPGVPVIGVPGADTARDLLERCAFPKGVRVSIMFDTDTSGDGAARVVARCVHRDGGIPLRSIVATGGVNHG